jgi:hypothetical protein
VDTLNKQMNLRQLLAQANDPNFGKPKKRGGPNATGFNNNRTMQASSPVKQSPP